MTKYYTQLNVILTINYFLINKNLQLVKIEIMNGTHTHTHVYFRAVTGRRELNRTNSTLSPSAHDHFLVDFFVLSMSMSNKNQNTFPLFYYFSQL